MRHSPRRLPTPLPWVLILFSVTLTGCGAQYGGMFDFSPLSTDRVYRMTPSKMYPDNPQARALVTAAIDGDVKKIDRLIDAGADPNAVGADGMSVPGWVLYHQNKVGFRRLLERGADPNKIWNEKYSQQSLMHRAAELSPIIGTDYLRMCLEIGKGNPNLDPPDHNYRVIDLAVQPGREEAFALLYKAGAVIDYYSTGYCGYSLIQHTAASGNFQLTLFMLKHGVNYIHSINDERHSLNSLHDVMQMEIRLGGQPTTSSQYMWFWRCVDWLEHHGMVFDYAPGIGRKRAMRPAVLDTTPPDPFHKSPAPVTAPPKNLSWLLQQVNLTSPLPVWADTPETSGDVKSRQRQKKGTIIIDYLPQDQTETDWKIMYSIMSTYTPGTTLEASESMVRKTLAGNAEVATEESAPDHRILRFAATGTEGVLYLGRYKDTIVTIREVWRNVDATTAATYRAKALAGMRQVVMEKGLNVVPLD